LIALGCLAQSDTNPSSFAVASVKRSQQVMGKDARGEVRILPNRLYGRNMTLKSLIADANHLQRYQVSGGPNWLDSEEYDIDARADSAATREQLERMLRGLLAERFRLSVHNETKELRTFALVVDRGGPRIHAIVDDEKASGSGGQRFHGELRHLADLLSIQLSIPAIQDPTRPAVASAARAPVLDKTGLTGTYDFAFDLRPDPGGDMFTAWQRVLQDQLGLKLESRKLPFDVLVVDHAERIPTAN
jgi:uncharacterized protein (TIGR03435 family)